MSVRSPSCPHADVKKTTIRSPLVTAAVTNPTEASFRSHLTELSFRRHLADIRQSDVDAPSSPTSNHEDGSSPSSSGDVSLGQTSNHHLAGSETPPIAPFRFANHVAISLRTPPLHYKTLFFLSLALTSPLAPPAYLSDPTPLNKKHSAPLPRERNVLYVGYLGHWVVVGQIPRKVEWVWRLLTDGSREKGRKKAALLDRPGISELRSIATKDEASSGLKAIAGINSSLASSKHIRKSDSIANLGESLGSLPLHAHPAPIPVAPFVPESRRASIVNLVSSQPPVNPLDTDTASSPLLTALKADLAAAQAALAEVKSQLATHEESVSSAHLHLQANLDEVRTRRKEDDAERQELKSRTKSLEEQKRQAEGARREAEKRLKAVEAVRDGLEGKIAAALAEIDELKGLMDTSVKHLRTVQEEGAKFVIETRESCQGKREELEEVEGDIGELDARNEELLRAIKEAEEKVESAVRAGEEARKIGPEEEMMMMAAAYEAAAQEGYSQSHPSHGSAGGVHGYRENRNSGVSTGNDQWAHQAAQYMAEAGMPYIDHQNYTARPSHSTSFGPFAKAPKFEDKRPADFIGFEDFGPGAQNRRTGATRTPPASDSGSDVWGHDPGSPNGGISSSFSQNLLPQGLFRSLEGDQTPLDAHTDMDDESVIGTGAFVEGDEYDGRFDRVEVDLNGEGDGSASDSSGDADVEHDEPHRAGLNSTLWRSPLPAPNALYAGHSVSERQLLPPLSRTPPGQPSGSVSGPAALPGLPVPLHGSRRWFSGTSSSEHVNIFGISPSNDSLLLAGAAAGSGTGPAGFESNPFAPTSSEKQQLALKWGALSKRWAARNEPSSPGSATTTIPRPASAHQTLPPHPGAVRSISADMSSGWITATTSGLGDRETTALQRLEPPQQQSPHQHQNGTHQNGEKKPFRFFSLRRPTSSGSTGDRTGTSPARE